VTVDADLVDEMAKVAPLVDSVEHFIVTGDGAAASGLPNAIAYDVGDDRQPEGGCLLAPDVERARAGDVGIRRLPAGRARPGAGGGANVPRNGVGH
jgi:hypothetical protein